MRAEGPASTNEPGAVDGRNDAPLATAEMEGGAFEIAGVTVTTTVALAVSYALSPLYSAVTMLPPADSCGALTTRVAMARPFDPASLADPSGAEPRKKVMVPCGVPPFWLVTVALRVTVSLHETLEALGNTAIDAALRTILN